MHFVDYCRREGRGNLKKGCAIVAKNMGFKSRTVESWVNRERFASHDHARAIVEFTGGEVDFNGIYSEPKQSVKKTQKVN